MAKKIFLIGMPAAGKTTFGKKIADHLGLSFLDLDHVIEEISEESIPSLFSKSEELFRQIESKALHSLFRKKEDLVISCGGGTPCFHDNLEQMKKEGTVLFLDTPLSTIISRVQLEDHRPLLQGEAVETKILKMYEVRKPYYVEAHLTTEKKEPDEEILNALTSHD